MMLGYSKGSELERLREFRRKVGKSVADLSEATEKIVRAWGS